VSNDWIEAERLVFTREKERVRESERDNEGVYIELSSGVGIDDARL